MSPWRVLSAPRSLASVIVPPVSSPPPRSGEIASRQGNSAAASVVAVGLAGRGHAPARPGAALYLPKSLVIAVLFPADILSKWMLYA